MVYFVSGIKVLSIAEGVYKEETFPSINKDVDVV